MSPETHSKMASFIWSICNLLRGPYKRNEYRKVILPLTVLKRFDAILGPTKDKVLAEHRKLQGKSENIVRPRLCDITGTQFYNLSRMQFVLPGEGIHSLLDDPSQLAPNLNSYIDHFSPNVRQIMERFDFGQHILRMAEKNILFQVVKAFCSPELNLSPDHVDSMQMGYIFEELIRIGAEQSNEEAGEHFTPREVIWLMVNLLLSDEPDLAKSHIVKMIYDPACGTGGMLSSAEQFIRRYNREARPLLYGQDWNDEAYAICKSDMLIKGEDAENIKLGDIFSADGFRGQTYDYMLANPPFGVSWKQQQRFIEDEHRTLGYDGRFGAGLPRVNDGAFLFLQHMIDKMRPVDDEGSRIAIVFNGSPLFTGGAGSGESEIRRWIIENDWLEAIVALPDQLFYNTGIFTYLWIVTNRKDAHRKGKVQLVDARECWIPMRKSLGNKRHRIGSPTDREPELPDQIGAISKIYGEFRHDSEHAVRNGNQDKTVCCKIFDNADFGYQRITVERPLRLNFTVDDERLARVQEAKPFAKLATSRKRKDTKAAQAEIEAGRKQQEGILAALRTLAGQGVVKDRESFSKQMKAAFKKADLKVPAALFKAILMALAERDETAEICTDAKGNPEPDPELRDYENVPLKEDIDAYMQREVLPHVPDAWVDESKTKVGYEINFNRYFYQYTPPRPLDEIETDLKRIEGEIADMLAEVTE